MDKSMLFCLVNSRTTFIEVRDMLNAEFNASLLMAWQWLGQMNCFWVTGKKHLSGCGIFNKYVILLPSIISMPGISRPRFARFAHVWRVNGYCPQSVVSTMYEWFVVCYSKTPSWSSNVTFTLRRARILPSSEVHMPLYCQVKLHGLNEEFMERFVWH